MTTSAPSALPEEQQPRVSLVPEYESSAADEAVDLARLAGLDLDPWEEYVLRESLGERKDGKWSAFEVGVMVSRQNGKGAIIEARELAALFLLGERLTIHSAHEFATSLEAFRRILYLIENTPEFDRRVKRVVRSHGEEGIELKTGERLSFKARTSKSGRGFSADLLVLDEAMVLSEMMLAAVLPTLSARPNPQVWYTGSAVDQFTHEHGLHFARVRERAHKGEDKRLAYFEWSLEADNPELVTPEQASDSKVWAQTNPGLGIRITEEYISDEQRALPPRQFAVERLGVGDWPATDGSDEQVIALERWRAATDAASKPKDPVCFAFDVTPDRSTSAIACAGEREDGLFHIEVVEHKKGTRWVPERLAELKESHKPAAVVCDASGPAASLLAALQRLDIEVELVTAKEHAQACGIIFDGIEQGSVRHLGTPELEAAVKGAKKRPLTDAWAWSRKDSGVDISPLVAVTLALRSAMPERKSAAVPQFVT